MADPRLRPKYVSFDCYGTLIYFEITSVTRRLLGDRLDEDQTQAFLRRFSKYRYDQVCGSYYAYQQVLHDAYARSSRLVAAIKKQRRQSRLVATTLASLKQLQQIGG